MKPFIACITLALFVCTIMGCESISNTNRLYDDQWARARDEVRPFESPIVYPLKVIADIILYPVFVAGGWAIGTLANGIEAGGEKGYL